MTKTKLYMTEEEICRSYRLARTPSVQIGTLADLNLVSESDIIRILIGNGMDLTDAASKRGNKRKKLEQIMQEELREAEQSLILRERTCVRLVKKVKAGRVVSKFTLETARRSAEEASARYLSVLQTFEQYGQPGYIEQEM